MCVWAGVVALGNSLMSQAEELMTYLVVEFDEFFLLNVHNLDCVLF